MNINYRNFVSFAMTLQILILLFATAVIPATAVVEDPSSLPLILQGTVKVDGELAPVNTQIIAKVNGDVVGGVTVGQDGIYGQPGNKLLIDCEPENYKKIKFYVNGVESQLVDGDVLNNAIPGDDFDVNMVATSPVGDSTNDGSSGSSGGGSYSGTATTSDSSTNDESSSESTASAGTTSLKSTQSTDDSVEEEVPASETGSSMMMAFGIGAIVLFGIIAIVGYKLKEN